MAFQNAPFTTDEIPSEYKVIITASQLVGRSGVNDSTITAVLPENYDLNVSSDYEAAFPGGFASFIGERSGALAQGLRLAGYNMQIQDMTLQVWQGSAAMDFSIPLEFIAYNDAKAEITVPIARLHSLAMPTGIGGNGGVFRSPGPTVKINTAALTSKGGFQQAAKNLLKGSAVGKNGTQGFISLSNRISLQIGTHLYFDNIVITSVGTNFATKFTPAGQPISASVNVGFRTVFTLTSQDMDKVFGTA